MPITVVPFTPDFVAEVGDLDLSKPLSPDDKDAVAQAFWTYGVLVFPDQELMQQQHIDFALQFGPIERNVNFIQKVVNEQGRSRVHPDISDVSNLDADSRTWSADSRVRMGQLANRLWHTDSSFRHVPALASLLYGHSIVPVGGHTQFADMRAAWDALAPAMQQRIGNLRVEHSIFASRAKTGYTDFSDSERAAMPPATQVLVRTLPQTGRRSLYLASHASHVRGMPAAESDALLEQLTAHATQRQFVHTHRWRRHDVVMWDNRCTMHRGTAFDDLRWQRDMRRVTVSDIGNTCEGALQ